MMSNKFYISGTGFEDATKKMADVISEHYDGICDPVETIILAVTRGGLYGAQLLSYIFNNRNINIVAAQSYSGTEKGELSIKLPDINFKQYKNIIVVDDIYDTGDTLESIRTQLEKNTNDDQNIIACATYNKKPNADVIFGEIINDKLWVVFPWDRFDSEEA